MWKNLIDTSKNVNLPWLFLGDFNESTHPHEKIGGNKPKDSKMILYRKTMDTCNLSDLGYIGSKFTWFNKRRIFFQFLRDLIGVALAPIGFRNTQML